MESDFSGQNQISLVRIRFFEKSISRNSIAHLMGSDFGGIRHGKFDVGGSTAPSVGYLRVIGLDLACRISRGVRTLEAGAKGEPLFVEP